MSSDKSAPPVAPQPYPSYAPQPQYAYPPPPQYSAVDAKPDEQMPYPPAYSANVPLQPPPPVQETYASNYADAEVGYSPKDSDDILLFDEKSVRLGFVRKVFGILSLQMLVTFAFICWFMYHEPTKLYVQNNFAVYIAAYVVFLVFYIVLACCKQFARNYPINVIALGIFTISLSYLVAAVASFHDTNIVLLLFGMTCLISVAIMLFACQTKYDFTTCGGVLFVLCFSLFFFGLFSAIFVPLGYFRILNIVYASLGALLFMGFLAFDTQLIMGGRKYELSAEDYVFAALMLYVDIIYIFIYLLALFGGSSK